MADSEIAGLVVKIKADLNDYLHKLDQMEKQADKSTSNVSKSFTSISTAMAKVGASLGAFATTAINSAMNWGASVAKLSKQTGMAAEETSKFLAVAKSVGVDTDTAGMMFARLSARINEASKSMTAASAKGKTSDDIFTKLGITTINVADGSMRPLGDIFADVKNKIAGMSDGWQKSAIEMELFGRSGTQLNSLLNMTEEQMRAVTEKAQAMGLIIDNQQAVAWVNLKRQVEATKSTLTSLGISIGNELIPQLQESLNSVQNVTKAFTSLDPQTRQNIISTIKLGAEIGITSIAITRAIGVIESVSKALGIMRLATISAAGPWVALAAAIGLAIDALDRYANAKYKVDGYNNAAEVRKFSSDDGALVKYQKKKQINTIMGVPVYGWVDLDEGETEDQIAFENRPKPEPTPPPRQPNFEPFIGGGDGGGGSSSGGKKHEKTADQIAQEEAGLWKARMEAGQIGKDEYLKILDNFAQDENLQEITRLNFFVEAQRDREQAEKESNQKRQAYLEAFNHYMLSTDETYTAQYRIYLEERITKAKEAYGEESAEYINAKQKLFDFDKQQADKVEQEFQKKRRLVESEVDFQYEMGSLSRDQYIELLRQQYEALKKFKGSEDALTVDAYRKWQRTERQKVEESKRAAERTKEAWADTLSDLATGDLTFKGLGKKIGKELVTNLFKGGFGVKSSGGGLLGGLFNPNGQKNLTGDLAKQFDILSTVVQGSNEYMTALNTITQILGLTTKPAEVAATTTSTVAKTTEASATTTTSTALVALSTAATTAAAALASISASSGASFMGFFEGGGVLPSASQGMITGSSGIGPRNNIPIIAHPKEMVLPRNISEMFIDIASIYRQGMTGGGNSYYHFNINTTRNMDEEKLARHLGKKVANTRRGGK